MLDEQIIELKGPGPPGRISTPITGCFHDKRKISKENNLTGLLFTSKILHEAMYFTSL